MSYHGTSRYTYTGSSPDGSGCFWLLGGAAILGLLLITWIIPACTTHTLEGVIVDTYTKGGDDAKYYAAIHKDDGSEEVLINVDSWLRGKVRSADTQRSLRNHQQSGQRVRLTVTGWRIPIFSKFRNIIEVEPVRRVEVVP